MRDLLRGIPRTTFKLPASPEKGDLVDLASPKSTNRSKKGGLAAKRAAMIAEKRRLLGVQDVKAQRRLKSEIRERLIKTEADKRDAEARRLKALEDEQAAQPFT